MSGTSYVASYKIQQIAQGSTQSTQEQLAQVAGELAKQIEGLVLLQQTIQEQFVLNFSYPVHKIHQSIPNPETETFEFWHPFGSIQLIDPKLIRVSFENYQQVPIELVYEWGWHDVGQRQGKIIIHMSPPDRFFGLLEVNSFFLTQYSSQDIQQDTQGNTLNYQIPQTMASSTTNLSGDLTDEDEVPIENTESKSETPAPIPEAPTEPLEPSPPTLPKPEPQFPPEEPPEQPPPSLPLPPENPAPVPPTPPHATQFSPNAILRFIDGTHAEDPRVSGSQVSADVMIPTNDLWIQVEAIANASGAMLYVDLIIEGSSRARLNYPKTLAEQGKQLQVSFKSQLFPPQVFPLESGSLIIN